MEINIAGIFPTPIITAKAFDGFSPLEKETIADYTNNIINNKGNLTSKNKDILHNKNMERIHSIVKELLEIYKINIFNASDESNLVVTQSWLNITKPKQYHHRHQHPNSIVSGVIYIETIPNDSIIFERPQNNWLEMNSVQPNSFTSPMATLSVSNGMIVLFPSNLNHFVEINNSIIDRITISFNTFFVGKIGDDSSITKLQIVGAQ